jgi:hypothetical protein
MFASIALPHLSGLPSRLTTLSVSNAPVLADACILASFAVSIFAVGASFTSYCLNSTSFGGGYVD